LTQDMVHHLVEVLAGMVLHPEEVFQVGTDHQVEGMGLHVTAMDVEGVVVEVVVHQYMCTSKDKETMDKEVVVVVDLVVLQLSSHLEHLPFFFHLGY